MTIERLASGPSAPTGSALALELVALTGQRWVTAHDFGALLEKFGVRNLEVQIQFLTGIKKVLTELPIRVFDDTDARNKVLSAAQDALDTAIEREELEK